MTDVKGIITIVFSIVSKDILVLIIDTLLLLININLFN